jgi:hypothetical protein
VEEVNIVNKENELFIIDHTTGSRKTKKNVLFFSRIQTSVHIIVLEEVEFKLQEFRTLSLVFFVTHYIL